jgi:hypothetical protein
MNGRWLTAGAWIAFAVAAGLLAHLMLGACDLGLHPLFGLRYCRAQAATPLVAEQERERNLLDRLHEAQLTINRLPVCLPEPPRREPERRADVIPPRPQPPTQPPVDRLTVPADLNELNGCWQSIRGDIPVVTDDQEHRIIAHRRICYCFSGGGNGEVRHIIQEGGRCVAPLKAQLSAERLTISHGQIPCSGVPQTLGKWDGIVPGDIICTKKAGEDSASCERLSRGKFPVTYKDEVLRRVDADNCG